VPANPACRGFGPVVVFLLRSKGIWTSQRECWTPHVGWTKGFFTTARTAGNCVLLALTRSLTSGLPEIVEQGSMRGRPNITDYDEGTNAIHLVLNTTEGTQALRIAIHPLYRAV